MIKKKKLKKWRQKINAIKYKETKLKQKKEQIKKSIKKTTIKWIGIIFDIKNK